MSTTKKKRTAISSRRKTKAPVFKKRRSTPGMRTAGLLLLEKKFFDFSRTVIPMSTTWAGGELDPITLKALSVPGQGDGPSDRDGRVFSLVSLSIKGQVFATLVEGATNPQADMLIRLIIVIDKQTNGAQLAAEDVMLGISGTNDVFSHRNLINEKRFTILWDKLINLQITRASLNEGAPNLYAHGETGLSFSYDHIFKTPLRVSMIGTTSIVENVSDVSIHVIGCAESTTANVEYYGRIRFFG